MSIVHQYLDADYIEETYGKNGPVLTDAVTSFYPLCVDKRWASF